MYIYMYMYGEFVNINLCKSYNYIQLERGATSFI